MPEIQKTVLHKKKNFLTWPLTDGFKTENDYFKIVKNKLQFLLSTSVLERQGTIEYGTGLWTHVFNNFTDAELLLIENDLRAAVNRWIPEIIIEDVIVDISDIDEYGLLISVYYSLPSFGEHKDNLTIGV